MKKNPKVTKADLTPRGISPSVKEMINKLYGRLIVTSFAGVKLNKKNTGYYVECKCQCGRYVLVNTSHLKSGKCVSCGCYKVDNPSRLKHGHAPAKGKREKIYHAWKSMHARCSERLKKHDKTRKYGEKGIKVCEGWSGVNGFINFKEQMNPPTDKSVDRINNDLHYSCGKCDECIREGWELNCRWANDDVQSNNRGYFNRYIMVDGIKMNHRQADRHLGYPIKTISGRIARGWTDEEAVSISPKPGNRKPKHLKLA